MALLHRRCLLQLAAALCAAPLAAVPAAARTRRATRERRRTVVIDPGHGGQDPGTVGLHGEYEKDIVFAAAEVLARELERRGRYRVVLTRTGDVFVPLHERVERARAARADLFLSLHANAVADRRVRGLSVFTLSETASDRRAAKLAEAENAADLIAGIDLSAQPPDVGRILFDLARRQTDNLSIRLARRLVSELRPQVVLLENAHRSAGFAVLKAPDIPSALIEIGCLSNPVEAELLARPRYQRKLAVAIAHGVDVFFEKNRMV
jgi:N-acetylmuramoyl-L-alanine amidase